MKTNVQSPVVLEVPLTDDIGLSYRRIFRRVLKISKPPEAEFISLPIRLGEIEAPFEFKIWRTEQRNGQFVIRAYPEAMANLGDGWDQLTEKFK